MNDTENFERRRRGRQARVRTAARASVPASHSYTSTRCPWY